MLLRRDAGKRLEPVGIMGRAVLHRPVLHLLGNYVGGRLGQLAALVHHRYHLFVHILRQSLFHLAEREHVLTENLFHIKHLAHLSPCLLLLTLGNRHESSTA